MDRALEKLRLQDQSPVLVLNAPEELKTMIASIPAQVDRRVNGKYSYILLFARDIAELKSHAKSVVEAIEEDGYLWICYPKGTSKKYRSDASRMKVLETFGPYNFEGVTQIAVDDDWSALRVKPVDAIKTMKRKWAVSDKGKERLKDNGQP